MPMSKKEWQVRIIQTLHENVTIKGHTFTNKLINSIVKPFKGLSCGKKDISI